MKPERSKSIILTGGGGMVAKVVLEALAARGHAAAALNRTSCDITDEACVRELFRKHKPTLLFNCAAYTNVDACEAEPQKAYAINGDAVGTLARYCKEYGARLVHYSSDFVFDGKSDRPYRPDDATNPLSAYGRSKLLGEQRIGEVNPDGWLIIRTSWLYGKGGLCFPRTILERAIASQPLKVVNDQRGSPTYVPDLANASIDLADHDAAGIWHLTNSGIVSWFDFAGAILEEFKLKTDLQPITSADWQKIRPSSAIRPAYSALDTSAFTNLTHHPLRPWGEALQEYRQAVQATGGF
ncbi:MAG TPA: dTDP-4-dehydrorhamnose reductase [Tepidisphaeraceae bacterium]|jgi:dTDP-4-dehydrorhamnose reductase